LQQVTKMNATLEKYAPWMLGLLRIVTALVYMEHGTQKLFHFPPQLRGGGSGPGPGTRAAAQAAKTAADAAVSAVSSMADSAVSAVSSVLSSVDASSVAPPPQGMPASMQTIFLIGGLIEFIGGLGLVLGIFTRPVAFIVAGECAVIFWWMHVSRSGNIFPATNGGEAAVLFCFTFLYLVFAGPGAFSIDGMRARRKIA
jgi:putative oxidoreductase